jgi:hypothetical protein
MKIPTKQSQSRTDRLFSMRKVPEEMYNGPLLLLSVIINMEHSNYKWIFKHHS